jgi:serine/threonine protein kinase
MLFICEYMQGGNLMERIHAAPGEGRPSSWYRNGRFIALCVARGLAYLHSNNVAWFDCKPSNVLLDHTGITAKIADFGLSRMLVNSHTNTMLVSSADIPPGGLCAAYSQAVQCLQLHNCQLQLTPNLFFARGRHDLHLLGARLRCRQLSSADKLWSRRMESRSETAF